MHDCAALGIPCRDSFWNIGDEKVLLYISAAVMSIVLFIGIRRHYRLWMVGKPEFRANDLGTRLRHLLSYGLGQRRTSRDGFAGSMHAMIYSGFFVLTIVTIMESIQYYGERLTGFSYLTGPLYLGYSLVGDLFGVVLLVGLGMAAYRRIVTKPFKLEYRSDDFWVLLSIFVATITGWLVEGPRIAVTELAQHPGWAVWSPVGFVVGSLLAPLGEPALRAVHKASWFVHIFSVMGVLTYLGYSKLGHILFGPLNIFFYNPKAGAALTPITDFEERLEKGESLGVAQLSDLTWKQLLDSSACIRCGRCTSVCPATASDKPLNPKLIILNIHDQLMRESAALTAPKPAEGAAPASPHHRPLVGGVIDEVSLWSCTTCRACMEECPMFIEHIPTIVDMRRNLVMDESRFSPEIQKMFENIEASGNPFRAPKNTRADWAEGMGVKVMAEAAAEGEDIDVLYWVGCAASHDERNQKVARSLVRTLKAANVNFAILGREETCNGDPARRCGNEYLFQMLAQENVETLSQYKFKRIVTTCAHCFNTFKNEYPAFGGQYQVFHHTEFINSLIEGGQLKVEGKVDQTVTYHDPCYIGRHNGMYDAPRALLNHIPGLNVIEMPRNSRKSFCCGGGGGQSFYEVKDGEQKVGRKINDIRTKEALDTGATAVAAACPYCTLMFEDGVKSHDATERFEVQDIVELVERALVAK